MTETLSQTYSAFSGGSVEETLGSEWLNFSFGVKPAAAGHLEPSSRYNYISCLNSSDVQLLMSICCAVLYTL
jgi:hypothetical protein